MQVEAHSPSWGSSTEVQEAMRGALGVLQLRNSQRLRGDAEGAGEESSWEGARDRACDAPPPRRTGTAGTHLVMAGGHDASWFCPRSGADHLTVPTVQVHGAWESASLQL